MLGCAVAAVCGCSFFNKKIGYMPQLDESLPSIRPSFQAAVAEAAAAGASGLDVELAASGFNKNHAKDLQAFLDGSEVQSDAEDEAGSDSEDECEDEDEDDGEVGSSDSEAEDQAADADELAERLAASCSADGQAEIGSSSPQQQQQQRRQQRSSKASPSTHQWLEQHAAGAVDADAVAAAAADPSSSDADAASDSGSEQLSDKAGEMPDAQAAAAAAAARAANAAARQQQGGVDGEGSIAPSRAPTDISFMVSPCRLGF